MRLDVAKWITHQIEDLPDAGKFRASSAIRSLDWASKNYASGMPIPATYFALHATEEAVAAFVSCAKKRGYGNDAKINLRDHKAKATVSLLAQKTCDFVSSFDPAIALNPDLNQIVARFTVDGQVHYQPASTNLFHFTQGKDGDRKEDFFDELVEDFGNIETLKKTVIKGQEARNEILYATDKGYPTGFIHPEESLRRECLLTLGLIWAALDIVRSERGSIALIVQALRTATLVIESMSSKNHCKRLEGPVSNRP
ncbi:hypothetical protein D6851_15790 [Altericroceibacterium spongiae]|uniref:Uncharacterized protein n=2 Tax=Altericroceibacterium spongiae TaxID=2320269 RepID=A0A420EAK2_9SPHN|nr:hypothetical protein D6851_15790 [Altericroceibacterium spongiae]